MSLLLIQTLITGAIQVMLVHQGTIAKQATSAKQPQWPQSSARRLKRFAKHPNEPVQFYARGHTSAVVPDVATLLARWTLPPATKAPSASTQVPSAGRTATAAPPTTATLTTTATPKRWKALRMKHEVPASRQPSAQQPRAAVAMPPPRPTSPTVDTQFPAPARPQHPARDRRFRTIAELKVVRFTPAPKDETPNWTEVLSQTESFGCPTCGKLLDICVREERRGDEVRQSHIITRRCPCHKQSHQELTGEQRQELEVHAGGGETTPARRGHLRSLPTNSDV